MLLRGIGRRGGRRGGRVGYGLCRGLWGGSRSLSLRRGCDRGRGRECGSDLSGECWDGSVCGRLSCEICGMWCFGCGGVGGSEHENGRGHDCNYDSWNACARCDDGHGVCGRVSQSDHGRVRGGDRGDPS